MSMPFGFTGSGGADDGAPFFRELERLMSGGGGGPVNWELAKQTALRTISATPVSLQAVPQGQPVPVPATDAEVAESVRLADLWLDGATALPSGVRATAAWTRRQWLEQTLPMWKTLCDPVAGRVVEALSGTLSAGLGALQSGDLPDELAGALPPGTSAADLAAASGPLLGMVGQVGGMLFGSQLGSALGALAGEVLTGTDVGLPLGPPGTAVLLPQSIAAYGAGVDVAAPELRLWLALRECAHQRLFSHVAWLGPQLVAAVEDYASGMSIDTEALGQAVQKAALDLDPGDPESVQRALGGGVFDVEPTPAQQQALTRLEVLLALVEGWVDDVVATAAGSRLPAAPALRELLRRRRAEGGPAEQTFAALVGLQLRPRRLREAAHVWQELAARRGIDGRDAVWETPELLPSGADLDDPSGYLAGEGAAAGADLMAELERITAEGDGPSEGDAPTEGDGPSEGDGPTEGGGPTETERPA